MLVAGSAVSDLAMHFLDRLSIVVVKVLSKFELRRLCRVVGATPLARLGAPTPEEMGYVDVLEAVEIGGDRVTVFRQDVGADTEASRTCTIVVRGGTTNAMDDVERAIDDGVNAVKGIIRDGRLVAGAGATEIELARRIADYGEKTPGLAQHAIRRYADALEVVPRTLAENAGLDATEVLSRLYAAHSADDGASVGVDIEGERDGTLDARKAGILDIATATEWALRYGTEAAMTVLRVDSIIMSKAVRGARACDCADARRPGSRRRSNRPTGIRTRLLNCIVCHRGQERDARRSTQGIEVVRTARPRPPPPRQAAEHAPTR